MNRQTRRQWLTYAAILFLCGALSGAVFGWSAARQRIGQRPRPGGGPPSGSHLCDHLRDGLRREFGLPEEQVRALEPLLQQRARQLDECFERSRQDLARVTTNSDSAIAAALNLSPAQRARLPELSRPPGFSPGRGGGPGRGPEREHERKRERDHENESDREHPRLPPSRPE